MKKILSRFLPVLMLLVIGVSIQSAAATSLLRTDHPDRYEVQSGDTLWDIASKFLTDAWRWQEIWEHNPDIENPHLIFPGDLVYLRYVDGKPSLAVSRGDAGRTVKLSPAPVEKTVGSKVSKLHPRVRETPLTSSIPAIPLDAISGLLTTGRIVEQDTLKNAPYILAGKGDRLILGPGDTFYARGQWPAEQPAVFGIFREGEVYQDPETREILGYEAIKVGSAKVEKRTDDIYTFVLTAVEQDVRRGDRLLPTEQRRVESMFYPRSPDDRVNGVIMTVLSGVTQVGRNDVVAVNRGLVNGLGVGDVLAIHKRGKIVRDRIRSDKVRLPSERAGIMMVFRSFEKMAYALVLETEEPLRVGDLVQNP